MTELTSTTNLLIANAVVNVSQSENPGVLLKIGKCNQNGTCDLTMDGGFDPNNSAIICRACLGVLDSKDINLHEVTKP